MLKIFLNKSTFFNAAEQIIFLVLFLENNVKIQFFIELTDLRVNHWESFFLMNKHPN